MYCPQCATENAIEASYCRGCGANISLVPQALTERLEEAMSPAADSTAERSKRRHAVEKPVSYEKAYQNIFLGVAFLLVAGAVFGFMPGGYVWWFWMLIPAFACFGEGYGQVRRLRRDERMSEAQLNGAQRLSLPLPSTSVRSPSHAVSPVMRPAAHNTAEMKSDATFPPPSITEGTTRLLDDRPELAARDAATRERG